MSAFDSIMANIGGPSAERQQEDLNIAATLTAAEKLGEIANWNVRAELEDGLEIEVWFTDDSHRYYTTRNGVATTDRSAGRGRGDSSLRHTTSYHSDRAAHQRGGARRVRPAVHRDPAQGVRTADRQERAGSREARREEACRPC